jgi:hypothetical protein
MNQHERDSYTVTPKQRVMYIIYIDDSGFEAYKNGDEFAQSASSGDLLATFNDILSNAGDPNARVQFVERQPPDDPKPFQGEQP